MEIRDQLSEALATAETELSAAEAEVRAAKTAFALAREKEASVEASGTSVELVAAIDARTAAGVRSIMAQRRFSRASSAFRLATEGLERG